MHTKKKIRVDDVNHLFSYIRQELKHAAWYNPHIRFPKIKKSMTGQDIACSEFARNWGASYTGSLESKFSIRLRSPEVPQR